MYKKNPNVLKQGSNFLMIPIQDPSIFLYHLTRHDITEILLKVALSTINQTKHTSLNSTKAILHIN